MSERLARALSYADAMSKSRTQFVYFLECDGHVKVGIALDISARISLFQTGSPHRITLLHCFKHKRPVWAERVIHMSWASHRVCGEWFKLSEATIAKLRIAGNKTRPLVRVAIPRPRQPTKPKAKRPIRSKYYGELAPVVLPSFADYRGENFS